MDSRPVRAPPPVVYERPPTVTADGNPERTPLLRFKAPTTRT